LKNSLQNGKKEAVEKRNKQKQRMFEKEMKRRLQEKNKIEAEIQFK